MGGCNRTISSIKRRIVINCGFVGIRRFLHQQPRVLFWHGVDYVKKPGIETELYPVDQFEKQIKYLRRYYEIISIDEFACRLEQNAFNGKEILLTFDDGYANNLSVVFPMLSALNLPFTVFISTDNVSTGEFYPTTVNRLVTLASSLKRISLPSLGQDYSLSSEQVRSIAAKQISKQLKMSPLPRVKSIVQDLKNNLSVDEWQSLKAEYDSLRPLTWSEVLALSGSGLVTIGSHCMWHICCHENHRYEDVERQIKESKTIIEKETGASCEYFAYPNGNFTDFSNNCVNATYRLGFSAETKTKICAEHSCMLPRIAAYMDMDLFKILITSR